MADSNTLAVSNRHIDSLIAYVLDTKPYHTKLSEVVEEYLFNDSFTVNVADGEMQTMAVLGLDYLKKSNSPLRKVWEKAPIRPESALSAEKSFLSDGSRRTFGVAPILVNKLFSQSSQEKFAVSESDTSEIAGLYLGVINPRRFDGPGIPRVSRNETALTESVDYHLSHGAYSFDASGLNWAMSITNTLEVYPQQNGALTYKNVNRHHGYVTDIFCDPSNEAYEEWTLTWNHNDQNLSVVGSSSGLIGFAEYGVPFVDSRINFTFTHSPGEVAELPASLNDGDKFVLTPSAKVTISPFAIDQTWTLIKVNPIALATAPVFSELTGIIPSVSIFTRGLERNPGGSFSIVFTSDTTYTLEHNSETPISGYPKFDLPIDKAFKDDVLHFKIDSNGRTFAAGEYFTFEVLEDKANYLVYGSISGWQQPATIGKWYFNGQIGFKIPELEYFVCSNGNFLQQFNQIFEPLLPPHSIASPSVYNVVFRPPVMDEPGVRATVENNIYGYRQGLIPGEDWSDEFCSFRMAGNFNEGDRVSVYLAPKDIFTYIAGYDEAPYDRTPYDMVTAEIEFPVDLLQEYFPLYHSYGAVIIPSAQNGDEIIIDKVEREFLRLTLGRASTVINGLGQNLGASLGGTPVTNETTLIPELGDNNTWVPLEFRCKDLDGNIAHFPDYAAKIEGYAASSPNTKIFEIRQPKNSTAVFEFDQAFFTEYLPPTMPFKLRFHQQSSYAQMIRIKISEHLHVDSDIDLILSEDSGESAFTGFGEGLSITEYELESVTRINLVFNPQIHNEGLLIETDAPEFVITVSDGTELTEVLITPEVGPPFNATLINTPYDQIVSATSVWSAAFSVPLGTAPFTIKINQTI